MSDIPTFKIALVGDGGVGKTALTRRLTTGEWRSFYVSTLGVEKRTLTIYTNRGPIRFDLWDHAGVEKFGGHRSDFYKSSDGAIVLFSLDSVPSYQTVPYWTGLVMEACEGIPVAICGNKMDAPNLTVDVGRIEVHRDLNREFGILTTYCSISAKTFQSIREPFLWLARQFLNDEDLAFAESPSPEVSGLLDA